MTCIVGLECDGSVLVAADSCVTWGEAIGDIRTTCGEPKIWTPRRGVIIGCAGNGNAQDLVEAAKLGPPKRDEDGRRYLLRALQPFLSGLVEEYEDMGLSLLVAVGGRLYYADGVCVTAAGDGYAAIGTGAPFALGSLYATQGRKPRQRAELALAAAERHCGSVRGPWTVLTTQEQRATKPRQ